MALAPSADSSRRRIDRLDLGNAVDTLFVPMVKKLQQVGNSHAIVLDRAIREAIGLQPDDAVQIVVSGDSIVITPARVGLGEAAVATSLKKLRPRYRAMLRKLAE
jgi:antitoxin component of MazEF toxin-antitoxin module